MFCDYHKSQRSHKFVDKYIFLHFVDNIYYELLRVGIHICLATNQDTFQSIGRYLNY